MICLNLQIMTYSFIGIFQQYFLEKITCFLQLKTKVLKTLCHWFPSVFFFFLLFLQIKLINPFAVDLLFHGFPPVVIFLFWRIKLFQTCDCGQSFAAETSSLHKHFAEGKNRTIMIQMSFLSFYVKLIKLYLFQPFNFTINLKFFF